MPTWRDVQNLVVSISQTALSNAGIVATIGVGYPPVRGLQNISRDLANGQPNFKVSVYDHGLSPDRTRWMPFPALNATENPSNLSAVVPSSISASSSGSISLSGTPVANDGLSFTAYGTGTSQGAVFSSSSILTLDELCEGLVEQINTNAVSIYNPNYSTLSVSGITGVVASYLGSGQIEIQNNRTSAIQISFNITNTFNNSIEIRRVMRKMQITAWANSPNLRDQICDPLELAFSEQQINFGSQFPDGTWGRILLEDDISIEDDTLQDVFRRDFLIGCEYGIIQHSLVYPVEVVQTIQELQDA